MRKKNNPGCMCCGTTCGTLDFTVTLCGVPVSGAVVNVTGPSSFSGSCTTNGSGQCSIAISAAGSYPWTVTPPGGVHGNSASGTKVIASCVAGSHNAVVVVLAAAAGYSCSQDTCCSSYSPPGPPYPDVSWPATLFLNDGLGTITLTSILSGAPGPWRGTATRTAAADLGSGNPPFDCAFLTGHPISPCGGPGTNPVTLYFQVDCVGNNLFRIGVGYYPCHFDPTACSLPPGLHCNGGGTSPTTLSVGEDVNCGQPGPTFDHSILGPGGSGSWPTPSFGFFTTPGNVTAVCPSPTLSWSANLTSGDYPAGGCIGTGLCSSNAQIVADQLGRVYGHNVHGAALNTVISFSATS